MTAVLEVPVLSVVSIEIAGSMNPWIWPVLFVGLFGGAWIGGAKLMSIFWKRLFREFSDPPTEGFMVRSVSMKAGSLSYSNALVMVFCPTAIYVRPTPGFRLFHPWAKMPVSAIERIEHQSFSGWLPTVSVSVRVGMELCHFTIPAKKLGDSGIPYLRERRGEGG